MKEIAKTHHHCHSLAFLSSVSMVSCNGCPCLCGLICGRRALCTSWSLWDRCSTLSCNWGGGGPLVIIPHPRHQSPSQSAATCPGDTPRKASSGTISSAPSWALRDRVWDDWNEKKDKAYVQFSCTWLTFLAMSHFDWASETFRVWDTSRRWIAPYPLPISANHTMFE